MREKTAKPVRPGPPLNEREQYWNTQPCRDLKWKPHRIRPAEEQDLRRCVGCDYTADMLDARLS